MSSPSYRSKHAYPCKKCGVLFAMNYLQAARVRADRTAPVYCSRACAGITAAPPVTCATCQVQFSGNDEQRRRVRFGLPVYCSRECYHKSKAL